MKILLDLLPHLGLFACFGAAFLLSTFIIRRGIPKLQDNLHETKSASSLADPIDHLIEYGRLPESASNAVFDWRSTGVWIGLCEIFLIFIFVFAGAFSALAIIIGAKQFVRNEKIKENPSYYLLGTLANLCIAIFFALVARAVISQI